MQTFRSWSRRAWWLHCYLIAAMVLAPVPRAYCYWSDTDSDGSSDSWVDPTSSILYSLAQLDAIGVDYDGDGAYNSEELTYGSSPLDYDSDNDGLNDGDEIHLAIQQSGKVYSLTAWDSNGDEISDFDDLYNFYAIAYPSGQLPNFPGSSYSDYDGDGIKNPFDPYPSDPANNDADNDGLNDNVDPVLGDASNTSPYNSIAWGADALGDADTDSIVNFVDSWPNDPTNGSNDSDGDGIENSSDPFPTDNGNYSWLNGINWQGDVFGDADTDGVMNYADQWPYDSTNGVSPPSTGGANPNDIDSDGITNDLDPAANDPNNYSSTNGYNWYGSALEDSDNDGTNNFNDTYPYDLYNNLTDYDGDGWANADDPFPKDSTNFSGYNQTAWGAGMFGDADSDGTPNWQDVYPNDQYNGVTDYDGDGIPNDVDPFPTNGANYSSYNMISWGNNALGDDDHDGTVNWQDESPYPGAATNDSDNDGYEDGLDPAPNDSNNPSPYNGLSWGGDVFGDADGDGVKNFWDQWPSDSSNGATTVNPDRDYDGIPNDSDPAPDDSSNYSNYNARSWPGNALSDDDYDGILNFFDYSPYADSNADSDHDGLLDINDPAPNDPYNYSSVNGWTWNGDALNDADGDCIQNFFDTTPNGVPPPVDNDGDGLDSNEEAAWGTSELLVDSDGDSLGDGAEVRIYGSSPINAHYLSQIRGWGDRYTDAELVDTVDSDRDGIPDRIELHYGLNPNWSGDALLDRDNDGVNNITQYNAGMALDANLSTYDDDGDGMTDVFEDGYQLSKNYREDAYLDADGDGVLNYEEQLLLTSPRTADTLQQGGLGDLQVLMLSVRYPDGSTPPADDMNSNGVPDWADVVKTTPTAPDYYHFTRQLAADLDGDGMPDEWEHKFGAWKYPAGGLRLRDARDALLDPDQDGLNNLTEYRFRSDPLVRESLHDGVSDSKRLYEGSHSSTTTESSLLSRYRSQITTDFSVGRGQTGWSKQDIVVPSTPPQGPDDIKRVKSVTTHHHTDPSISATSDNEAYYVGDTVEATSQDRPSPLPNTGCTCGCRGTYSNPRPCPGTPETCSCGEYKPQPDPQSPYEYTITPESNGYGPEYCHCTDQSHSSQEDCPNWYGDPYFIPAVTERRYHTRPVWESWCTCEPPTNVDEDQQWTTQKAFFEVSLTSPDESEDHYFRVTAQSSKGSRTSTWLTIPRGTVGPVEFSQAAQEGETITLFYDPPEEDSPPEYPPFSLSASDSAGSRYRKIGLNGMPMPDSKPQVQDESGERSEETYIDAFTRQLHHSVTDVYANEPSTLLPLSVRRDSSSDAWNQRSGQRIDERPDLPFGPAWSSNLCSYIHFETHTDSSIKSAQVVDEQGAGRRFLSKVDGTSLWHHSMEERQDMRTLGDVFTGMTLIKKFGTRCTYMMTSINQTFSNDRLDGSDAATVHTYARLTQVQDRLGNRLVYSYSGDSLIPDRISDPDRPGRQIFIMHNGRRVSSIRGPSGEEVSYNYTPFEGIYALEGGNYALEGGFLSAVTRGGTSVQYGYQTKVEDDINAQTYGGHPTPITHHELSSITDERGGTYQFTRMLNHDFTNENLTSEGYIETRVQLGLPMLVTRVTCPEGQYFDILGSRRIATHLTGPSRVAAFLAYTHVLGPAGAFTYTFGIPYVYTPPLNAQGLDDDISSLNYTVTYLYTSIASAAGSENYTFNPSAMFALSSATDLSQNTTTFGYEGGWDDPVSETDALNHTKTYTYDPSTRIMTSMTDALGTTTTYGIENRAINNQNIFGRKISEVVTAPTGETRATYYAYDHPTFHGMVTKQWTVSSNESVMPSSVTLTTLGEATDEQGDNPGWWTQVTQTTGPATAQGTLASTLSSTTTIHDFCGNKRTVIDGRGMPTNFDYDAHLRLKKVTHPDGSHKDLEYDAHGNLVKEINENGGAVIHTYDGLNRRTKTTIDLNGNGEADSPYTTVDLSGLLPDYDGDIVTSTTYNARSQVLSQTDPRGKLTRHEYDEAGRLTKTIEGPIEGTVDSSFTTQFFYDGINNGGSVFDSSGFKPNRIIDPRLTTTLVSYDELYRPVTHTIAADGITAVTLTTYDAVGHPVTVTDPLQRETTHTYNGLGELVLVTHPDGTTVSTTYTHTGKPWQVTDENGKTTTTTYDALGRAVRIEAPAVNGEQAVHTTEYDAAGNVIRATDALGRETETEYDMRNRAVAVYAPPVWNAEKEKFARPVTQSTYDALGQVLTVRDPLGNVTRKLYDEAGRNWKVVAPAPEPEMDAPTTITSYDQGGLALTVTNALGQTVSNTYDIHGRLITTVDAAGITNTFEYDAMGNRTSVKDGKDQETTFVYDGLNRLTSQTFANGDTWNHTYNAVQKLSQTSPRGIVTSYSYDARDRILTTSAPGLNRIYTYDPAGHLLTVTEEANPAANVAYTYDELGRVTFETSRGVTHSYSYDLVGNRTLASYGTGRSVQMGYDALNRPELISEGGRVTQYGYDLAGRAVILVAGNGQTSQNSYDALGRLVDRTLFKTTGMGESEVLAQFSWTHDALGNVRQQLETWPGDFNRSAGVRSTSMTYDADNRLSTERVVEPTLVETTTTYAYDAANNRVQKTVEGGSDPGVWHYTYNAANQLTHWEQWDTEDSTMLKSAALDYDEAGNRVSQNVSLTGGATGNGINPPPAAGGTTSYEWDAQDRLTSVTLPDGQTHAYDYDYRTRRIGTQKLASGVQQAQTAIVFAGGLSLAEWDSSTSSLPAKPTVEYMRGPDMGGGVGGMLYSMRASGTKYSLSNGRGDIVAQADSTATLTWTASYEAYGRRTTETGVNQDKQRGNSKDEDPTGLLNEGFRYRDLETGVWLSRDPAGFVDGPNLYAYVQQNPWTAWDPDGLLTEKQRDSLRETNKNAEKIFEHLGKDAKSVTPEDIKKEHLQRNWMGWPTSPHGSRMRNENPGESDDDVALIQSAKRNTIRAQVLLAQNGLLDKKEITKLQLRCMATLAESTIEMGLMLAPYSRFVQVLKPAGLAAQVGPGGMTPLMPLGPMKGPVQFKFPPNATPLEMAEVHAYVNSANHALRTGALSPLGRVSTAGPLRAAASRAASAERAAAAAQGRPYTGVVGHGPDTTWTGTAVAPRWLDQTSRVNSSLGGQAAGYPAGFRPTGFTVGD